MASGVKLQTLLFEFGHTGSANVLRAHYVGKASKKHTLDFSQSSWGENAQALKHVFLTNNIWISQWYIIETSIDPRVAK